MKKMEVKYLLTNLILSILILGSCVSKKDVVSDNLIVYELNKTTTDSILNIYNERYKGKPNCYVNLDNFNRLERKIVSLDFCEDCKLVEIIKKSNRFLELDENTLIPVIFNVDVFYEKKSKLKLIKRIGGATIIELDEKDNIIDVTVSM